MAHGSATVDRIAQLISLLGPETAAELTRSLTDDEAAKIDAWIEQDAPVHKLLWEALDDNGQVKDPAAFARLKEIAGS